MNDEIDVNEVIKLYKETISNQTHELIVLNVVIKSLQDKIKKLENNEAGEKDARS